MYSFVFVVSISVFTAILDMTKFSTHLNLGQILQLIKGISDERQKLLKYFSGTAICAPVGFLFAASAAVFTKMLDLYLIAPELSVVTLPGYSCKH